ncbi:NUDIX domain-containing protein [Deinococcus sp. YIM 134068]|uniref:NUDIX hydrolase n=1 Tax=Deinococcus lichenicola TaxID=3118910 RepID=UPI002F91EDA3
MTWLPEYWPGSGETVTQVSGVCLTGEGLIVLVSGDGHDWSLPGGKPEDGEMWEETLRREVAEEACADVLNCELMGAQKVEGLTPQPYFQLRFWVRVRLNSFSPLFEKRHRRAVSPEEYGRVLSWGSGAIGQALLRQALEIERRWRGG